MTQSKKKQDELRILYQIFRSNFVYIWLVINLAYGVGATMITNSLGGQDLINTNTYTFLDGMALFIGFLVVFKFFAALFYTIKWNVRFCRSADYRRLGN